MYIRLKVLFKIFKLKLRKLWLTIKHGRINFSSIKSVIDYPDFLDVQLKSFIDFFQLDTPAERKEGEGLYKVFMENFPDHGFSREFCSWNLSIIL